MNDYLVIYIVDGEITRRVFLADSMEWAVKLFRLKHPLLKLLKVIDCDVLEEKLLNVQRALKISRAKAREKVIKDEPAYTT